MNQRGRRSTESLLMVVPFVAQLPEPPESLTGSQVTIFRHTAAAMPAGWCKADTVELLAGYSRAVDACNNLALVLQEPELSLKERLAVLAGQEKQMRLVVTIATKMRLTQQARILPDQAGRDVANKPAVAPPWAGARDAISPGSKSTAKYLTVS